MSITTITINTVGYTSYASLAEADDYLAVDPVRGAAWAALSVDERGARLVAATRRLDLLAWQGEKTGGSAQVPQWPRTGVTFPNGDPVPTDEVPQGVEDATILLAGSIELDAATAQAGDSGSNVKRTKAGSAEVEFFRPQTGGPLQDATALALVVAFLEAAALGGELGPLATGTGAKSAFDDDDAYGRTRGFP